MFEWNKEYVEHNPVHNFGVEDTVAYHFDWTAPDVNDGEIITIYTSAVFGNDDGANTGDLTILNSFSATVSSSLPPTLSVSKMDVSCFGGNDGSANAMANGGLPSYIYNWSNGITEASNPNLAAGTYTVTVTDNNSLTSTSMVTIEEPSAIELAVDNIIDETDFGNADGGIEVTINGGIPPYSFSWTDNNGNPISTNEDPSQLNGGNYFLNITDQNNCVFTSNEISVGTLVANKNLSFEKNINVFPNPSTTNIFLDFKLSSSFDFEIIVYDVLGNTMLQKSVFDISQKKLTIDISNFPNGVYWIQGSTKEEFWVKKFIVQK